MHKPRRIISNDTECKDLEVREAMQVAVPKGMTWGELKDTAVRCIVEPGIVYVRQAGKRAERAGTGGYREGKWSIDGASAFFVGLLSTPSSIVIGVFLGMQTVGALSGPVFIGGTIAAMVGTPWLFLNAFPAVDGLYMDTKTILKKAGISTLPERARACARRVRDTPIRETLRLEK